MTLPSTPRRAGPFYGDGSATQFPFSFKTYARGDIAFVLTPAVGSDSTLILDVDYTVTLNVDQANAPGGYVTYPISGSPLATGNQVSIGSDMDYGQPTALPEGGAYRARNVETMSDRLGMLILQLAEKANRALTFPLSDGIVAELPPASERANMQLLFDGNGDPYTAAPASGSAADVVLQLASVSDPSKGAGQIGFLYSLAYGAGTVGRWLKDLATATGAGFIGFIQLGTGAVLQTVRDFLRQQPGINVSSFGAKFDGVTDDSAAWALAKTYAAATKRPLYLPNGTHLVSAQVFNDLRIGIIGESTLGTIVKAPASFTGTLVAILNTTNNGGDTFECIEKLTLQGTYGVGSVGLDQALCSRSALRDVRVQGFDTGVRRVNSFCMLDENVEINDCRTDLFLVGSNHNSEHVRCSYVGAGSSWGGTGTAVKITNNGADSLQSSLAFRGCDLEFGGTAATGVSAAMTGTLLLDNCYAEALGGTILQMNDGHCDVLGGEYIIKDSTGFLCDVVGGGASITFDDEASISSDGSTRVYASIIKTGGSGFATFLRTRLFEKLITSNVGTLPRNIGRSVVGQVFLKPQGRFFTKTDFTGVSTVADTGDTRRVTCTTAGTVSVFQAFTQQPRIGANVPFVMPYQSNQSFQLSSVGAAGQSGTITSFGTLPASGGSPAIAVFPAGKITIASQTGVEFWRPSWAIGDYLEIAEAWMYDGGAILNGQLSLG